MPIDAPSPEQAGAAAGGTVAVLAVVWRWVRKSRLINPSGVAALFGDPAKPEDGTFAKLVRDASDAATRAADAAQEAALASASNAGALEQIGNQVAAIGNQVATGDHNNARAFGRLEGHFDDLARRQAETEAHVAKLRERMDDTQRRLGMRLRASDTPTPGAGTPRHGS